MLLSKDVYEYLINFADDKTILNMLSVNKKFHDENFFKKVLMKRYPLLIKFKEDEETWKQFYIKMIFYISKLNEKFRIPYINVEEYNPEDLYINYKQFIANNIKNLIMKPREDFKRVIENYMINEAIEYSTKGDLKITKYLIEKGADLNNALIHSIFQLEYGEDYFDILEVKNNSKVIEYLLNKGGDLKFVTKRLSINFSDLIESLLDNNISPIIILENLAKNKINVLE